MHQALCQGLIERTEVIKSGPLTTVKEERQAEKVRGRVTGAMLGPFTGPTGQEEKWTIITIFSLFGLEFW